MLSVTEQAGRVHVARGICEGGGEVQETSTLTQLFLQYLQLDHIALFFFIHLPLRGKTVEIKLASICIRFFVLFLFKGN